MPTTTTRSVERALKLLTVVCDHPGINLTKASEQADLSPSSALRLLHTLEELEFVRRDRAGKFDVGSQLLRLGFKALGDNTLRNRCRPTMLELAERTGESVYLSIKQHHQALYLAVINGTHAIQHRSWEGQTIPLTSTAVGAVLLNQHNDEKYTVVTSGVEADVTAIATPLQVRGKTIAALSMLVPTYRITPEKAAELGLLIHSTVQELSQKFEDI